MTISRAALATGSDTRRQETEDHRRQKPDASASRLIWMMNHEEIHALFLKFAAPLAFYIRLGGRKEAMETIAKMLWGALLGGAAVERRVWSELREAQHVEPGLVESLQACYDEEMKPLVSEAELAELRRQYGIIVEE